MIRTDRVVESVDGDRITLDVPLSDALDSQFTAASLVHYSFPGRITEVGVEGLRIAAPFEDVPITDRNTLPFAWMPWRTDGRAISRFGRRRMES